MSEETAVATAVETVVVAEDAPAIHKCRRNKATGQISERTRGRPSDECEYGYTLNGDFVVGEPPAGPKGKRGRPKGSGTKTAKVPKVKVAKTAKVKVAKAPTMSKKEIKALVNEQVSEQLSAKALKVNKLIAKIQKILG
jgi:hypothetical protein